MLQKQNNTETVMGTLMALRKRQVKVMKSYEIGLSPGLTLQKH